MMAVGSNSKHFKIAVLSQTRELDSPVAPTSSGEETPNSNGSATRPAHDGYDGDSEAAALVARVAEIAGQPGMV